MPGDAEREYRLAERRIAIAVIKATNRWMEGTITDREYEVQRRAARKSMLLAIDRFFEADDSYRRKADSVEDTR